MSHSSVVAPRAFAAALVVLLTAFAPAEVRAETAPAEPPMAEPPTLPWTQGPGKVPVGEVAEIAIDPQYLALDHAGTQRFLELTQNPSQGNEVAVVAPASEEGWFLVFEFDEIGFVRDDEKDELDADAMLASIREGTEAGNAERTKRGWPTMEIVGWQEPPHYDARTNNLTWAIIGQSGGEKTVNKLVKLLGRRGVMTVTIVASPEEIAAVSTKAEALLAGYEFRQGHSYAEFVEGSDSVAEIGLKGLILGGAGAALIKSGLLGKFWKLIVAGVAGVGALAQRLLGRAKPKDTSFPT